MNERILELAIQAREYAETKPDIYQVAYDKKFAELIVRECSGFVYNYPEKYLTRDQAREISVNMEEHFGVEE